MCVCVCVQILQVEADSLPSQEKTSDDVSPVSQAWFTTKEDKDTLANKGRHTQCVILEWDYFTALDP